MSQVQTAIEAMTTLGATAGEEHLSKDTYSQIKSLGLRPFPQILYADEFRRDRGVYFWPTQEELASVSKSPSPSPKTPKAESTAPEAVAAPATNVHHLSSRKGATIADRFDRVIPAVDENYVRFGEIVLLEKIVRAKRWFPLVITGDSGFGKTTMVEQACAKARRELFRVNFNSQTDEGDLIGEKGLADASTFFEEGPVLAAMRRGAILLLDELDYSSPQGFTAIQSVMEGGAYLNKKTGERIVPAPGFSVVATMNTKGRGDTSGRFIGTQLMNVAFLDRFVLTFEHEAPSATVETEILSRRALSEGLNPSVCTAEIKALVDWAAAIRAAFNNDAIEENMSTRRLGHIISTMALLGPSKVHRAVSLCLNRFDESVSKAMFDLFLQIFPKNQTATSTDEETEQ